MDGTEKEIYDKVGQIFEDITGMEHSAISPENTLAGDLDVDSLTLIEVAVAIQDEFHITVPDERIRDLVAVSDVVTLVREALVAAA